ncbi:hypothetical protein Ocin01_05837 [Orchesella cincta]|uniref:Uncharacterized protein n=1 Tax=Orchesella cincta TaxID=48709 RepID=A0A1D2N6Z5_ORCCI|nr:hypothetical protein Ocin01_05837 [Orchesella cincta]
MDSETQDVDTVKIQAENRKLKKEMRELVIQKNTMEDRLYRAANKVLNTKKRRIKQLEAELETLKKNGNAGDAGHHCKNCRCGVVDNVDEDEERDEPVMKKTRKTKQMPGLISDDDSDNTEDPGSRYGSDTDIDEEPASVTSSRNTSPVKPNTGAVASREPTLEKVNVPEPVRSPLTNNDDEESEDSQSILNPDVQISKPPSTNPELQGSQKSDYDMEDMMEEFCS